MKKAAKNQWWSFCDRNPHGPVTGEFGAVGADRIGRLYFPLVNEAGMFSWVSPWLQGSPASSHNEYLGLPLSAEDLAGSMTHRGFWLAEDGRAPFSLSSISPDGLAARGGKDRADDSHVEAGPGWFRLVRNDAAERFVVSATLWCPADLDEKVEVMQIEVTNTSRRTLSFVPYAAIPLFARSADNLRDHRHVTALLHRVALNAHGVTVCPTMTFDERGHEINHVRYSALAFGPGGKAPAAIWPTQESFLGEGGTFAAPAAVWRREESCAVGLRDAQGQEALGGFRFAPLKLKAGQSAQYVFVSGIAADDRSAARWIRWAGQSGRIAKSLTATEKHWAEQIGRVEFATADAQLNNWLAWVNSQPILRRLYGNSYLPQFDYGRGGKGWRDLWQDCLALLLSDPESVRPMLLHNFAGIRIDGSNATIIGKGGAFIADRNNIPRTWMDHGVWPVYTTLLYVDQTGDLGFLLREREYFRDPQLFRCRRRDEKWTPEYGYALRAKNGDLYRGTILEHMLVQNLTAFFNVGEHNVCRLEGADWNDGLDMAAHRGESVAFTSFYAWNLERLAQVAEVLAAKGHTHFYLARELVMLLDRLPGSHRVNYDSVKAKQDRLQAYLSLVANDVSGHRMAVSVKDLVRDLRAKSRDVSERIRKQEWVKAGRDGSFFNGYYDDHGKRVEGRNAAGTRMSLTGQVFPVMAGIATEAQTDGVIQSVRKLLRDPRTGGVRLNTDFGGIQHALGRAFSFAYGEKENGAVFSHMAVMYSFALYLRRRPVAARSVWASLYRMASDAGVSKIFPCIPEYFNGVGRGMYAYLTGSASWLIYLLLTQVFGVRGEAGDLVIDPQLTLEDFDAKGRCAIRLHFAGRPLKLVFANPLKVQAGNYAIGQVSCGSELVPHGTLPQGGVRIRRARVEELPAGRETTWVVELVRK